MSFLFIATIFLCCVYSMTMYKLSYFDAKGAAELARVLFHIGDIEFVDDRYQMTPKADGKGFDVFEFTKAKESGELNINMGRLPILTLSNGVKIGQSRAIERFIAKKCNLMGENEEECALIDCVAENIRDIRDRYGKIRTIGGMGPNPEKDIAMKKWFDEELKEWLIKLENSLPSTTDSFAVGNQNSYADICVWYLINEAFDNKEAVKKALETCPKLISISNRVAAIPSVINYISNRKVTKF